MTTCPACRWENDVDSGPCGGCGRELAAGPGAMSPGLAAVPEPRPYLDGSVPPPHISAPEPDPSVVHRVAEPVQIRPQTRPVPHIVEPSRDAPRAVDVPRAARPAETTRRANATVREIPVVVAPAASRASVRFRDEDVGLDPGRPLTAPAPAAAGTGTGTGSGSRTSLCPSCGAVVDAGRRFCRCGARLPAAEVHRADAGVGAAQGWSTAAFRRAQRAANGGRRVRYDAPLSARTYLVRALLVVLLVLAVGSQAPPWGADLRHWVETRVEQALPGH